MVYERLVYRMSRMKKQERSPELQLFSRVAQGHVRGTRNDAESNHRC